MKNLFHSFIFLGVIVLLTSCLEEYQPPVFQSGGVRGIVKDANNSVLGNAFIYTVPWTYVDTSNEYGIFEISDLQKEEYFLFAEREGYLLSKQKVKINSGEKKEIVFVLDKVVIHNSPPVQPLLLFPDNGATQVRDSILLGWKSVFDANGDSVFYDVYADKNSTPITRIYSAIADTFCVFRNLESSTSYYWRVIATDKESYSSPSTIRRFNTAGNSEYQVLPPQGKLPYPHHNPEYTQEEYDNMMERLWIVDTFGDYVSQSPATQSFISTGLKMYAGYKAPIFTITNGIVRIKNSYDYEKSFIVIEDLEEPGYAWKYEGLENFQYSIGDYVEMGSQIGQINNLADGFYTLSRIKKPEGVEWGRQEWLYINAQEKFEYIDTKPPEQDHVLKVFRGNTTESFEIPEMPRTFIVYGEADIVYNAWDVGEYADPSFETEYVFDINNAGITRYECILINQQGEEKYLQTYDFREIKLVGDEIFDIYYPHTLIPPKVDEDEFYRKYCILTNAKEVNGELITDFNYSWDTTEKDMEGNPLYPNGKYVMTIRAYDFKGNFCSRVDTVLIRN